MWQREASGMWLRIALGAVVVCAAIVPWSSSAEAQQVRIGGGGGSAVTVEFLEDILVTLKPGFSLGAAELGIQLNGVLTTPNSLLRQNGQTATPSNIFDWRQTGTSAIVSESGSVVGIGVVPGQPANFSVGVALAGGSGVTLQDGGSYMFKAGTVVWPSPGTTTPWVTSPQTFTVTPGMLYADNEGVTFLTSSDVTITTVPEPSTACMMLAVVARGGFSMWRRRKRA